MAFLRLLRVLFFGPRVTEPAARFVDPRDGEFEQLGEEVRKSIQRLYGGRSLGVFAVDGGSSNAEEHELRALANSYYDIERFGLSFVASPRQADILAVTGPVTRNLAQAVKATYEAMPQPGLVVAVGDGACTGGIWSDSYAVVGPVESVIPVHVRIPGDPPSPTMILRGVLQALQQIRASL